MRNFDATDWHAAVNGTGPAPWFVARTRTVTGDPRVIRNSLIREYAERADGQLRRFKTREAAQKVADKMQATADFDAARESARLACYHLIRATDGLTPDHKAIGTLAKMSDLYLELTGQKL